MGKRYTKY